MRVEGVNSVGRMAPMEGLARAGKPSPPEVSSPPKPASTPVPRAQKAAAPARASRKDAPNPFAAPRPPVDVDVREFLSMTAQLLTQMAATHPQRIAQQLDLHV